MSPVMLATVARITTNPRAFVAPSAIEAGSTWVTLDRDFARFPGLDWRVPAAG